MTFFPWARVARSCVSKTSRTVGSVLFEQRSFSLLATRRTLPLSATRNDIRSESSAATQRSEAPPIPVSVVDAVPEFSSLKGAVHERTLKAITQTPFTYTNMSSVQAEVLPLLPELARPYNPDESGSARDLLVKAKTGTGKTLAFLVPAIEARLQAIEAHVKRAVADAGQSSSDVKFADNARMAYKQANVGTLIISPTRELATQIATEAKKLTMHHKAFGIQLFFGGESKFGQMRNWKAAPRDIVVSTPGRLRDVLNDPSVARAFSKTQVLILDEADTLLDMGFKDDITDIMSFLPSSPERQTFLFSATVSRAIRQIASETLAKDHRFINCVSADDSPVHAHIPQYHTVLPSSEHQVPHLLRLIAHDQLQNPGHSKIIVFLPTTKMTQLFSTVLKSLARTSLPSGKNTNIYEIHSKRTMEQRTRSNKNFREDMSGASILVTSDVSARGVDYPGVTRVVQIGIPGSADLYIHRVGRTGRAGKTGGRGDLVLLPFEIGFIRQTLSAVPLKPISVSELATQVKELSEKFDESPDAFFAQAPKSPKKSMPDGRFSKPIIKGSRLFTSPVSVVTDDIERNTRDLVAKFDEESIQETFGSLLGYYAPNASLVRTTKSEMLSGLREWAMGAGGLEQPPHTSDNFLARLGFGDVRSGRGRGGSGFGSENRSRNRFSEWGSSDRQNSYEKRNSYDRQSSYSGGNGSERRNDSNGGSSYGRASDRSGFPGRGNSSNRFSGRDGDSNGRGGERYSGDRDFTPRTDRGGGWYKGRGRVEKHNDRY